MPSNLPAYSEIYIVPNLLRLVCLQCQSFYEILTKQK